MNKLLIPKHLQKIELLGTIDESIEYLQQLKEDYADYENLTVKYYSSDEGGFLIHWLIGHRLETDDECQQRINDEARWAEEAKRRKRQEYEKLKAEFESEA